MIHFALLLALSGPAVLLDQSNFPAEPASAGWHVVAQRAEISPRGWIDRTTGRGGQGALALAGDGKAAVSGGWERKVGGIEAGAWYRLTVESRSAGIDFERQRVVARLDWQKGGDERSGQPDYGTSRSAAGDWNKTVLEAPAPAGASQVQVQLLLSNAPQGTVWWDHIRLEKIDAPKPRMVRVATVNYCARNTRSAADSVAKFIEVAKLNVKHSDLLVLPEAISISGNGLNYVDAAEPIPGPSTEALGQLARDLNSYVVAGLMEREGASAYNTAVLIDRHGVLAGKYRKIYLPREEVEGGLTPGQSYPVFDTDFGRLGLMICWDIQYADPARALALGGAELIALPIAGGNLTLGHARAIENHVFLVSSGYDYPTEIVDPDGKTMASAHGKPGVAVAEIDLNHRYTEPWLGNMRDRFFFELRADVPLTRR
jgi:predicted amidohydrolase